MFRRLRLMPRPGIVPVVTDFITELSDTGA
jgi:hypothetical protein